MTLPGLPGGIDLSRQGVPPKEQRILAPSLVGVEKSGGYAPQCVCSVRIVDPINLVVYYVPMTVQMGQQLIIDLGAIVNTVAAETAAEDNHK